MAPRGRRARRGRSGQSGKPAAGLDLQDAEDRPAEVDFVGGDIRDRATVERAVDGVDVVFHNVAQVPLAKDKDLFWSVNVLGTATPTRYNTGVNDGSTGAPVSPGASTSPVNPADPSAPVQSTPAPSAADPAGNRYQVRQEIREIEAPRVVR